MLRIITAALALTFFAGVAQADVINVIDDATSENDAILLDEGKEPYSPGSSTQQSTPSGSSSDQGLELKELDREMNQ